MAYICKLCQSKFPEKQELCPKCGGAVQESCNSSGISFCGFFAMLSVFVTCPLWWRWFSLPSELFVPSLWILVPGYLLGAISAYQSKNKSLVAVFLILTIDIITALSELAQ
ncbi:MAG: hypothetical protein IJW05_11355 [Lentisphaeria bacterium]|nr:hypothetical protein [Lentisphaeria bacterium]